MKVQIVNNHKEEVINAAQEKITLALEAIALQAEGYVQLLTPVDTGRLRNSISHKVIGDTAYIGTNVEYAPYVEFGHHSYQGAHFLRDGITDHLDEYKQIAESILKE